jgi:hypothetical protein
VLEFYKQYAKDITFSQNGEEGVCLEVLRRLKIKSGHACEIGGSDGRFCSNTAYLIEQGWSGLFVEADRGLYERCVENWKGNDRVSAVCSKVTGDNVNMFVDERCDVLSTDTDGSDYEIFMGLRAKPKIVIVEIDSGIEPHKWEFNRDGGASYLPAVTLGIEKGYFLLCHTGNLVFVRQEYRDKFPEIVGDGIENAGEYFRRDWL